jgi:hypothetical protein
MQADFPQNVSWRLHPIIPRAFSENERIPIMMGKPIGLIRG